MVEKGYVKYTFPVKAGKVYFIFSNSTKTLEKATSVILAILMLITKALATSHQPRNSTFGTDLMMISEKHDYRLQNFSH